MGFSTGSHVSQAGKQTVGKQQAGNVIEIHGKSKHNLGVQQEQEWEHNNYS